MEEFIERFMKIYPDKMKLQDEGTEFQRGKEAGKVEILQEMLDKAKEMSDGR